MIFWELVWCGERGRMGETMSSRVIDGVSRLEGEQWECDLWVSGMIRRAAKMVPGATQWFGVTRWGPFGMRRRILT